MFRVEWLMSAQNELASIWLQADSTTREAITAAVQSIDQWLQTDPHLQGESRERGRRVLFAPPLGIDFEFDFRGRVVTVLHVWRFTKRQ